MRFMRKGFSEIQSQSTTLHKNMNSNYNQRGISTPAAKLMKAGADQIQGTPRWMPIMAKCAISANVADPIDREKECRCAAIDFRAGIYHYLAEMLRSWGVAPNEVHRCIDAGAEYQKHMVAEQAVAYREQQRWASARCWRAF